jgi:hypothetical protein
MSFQKGIITTGGRKEEENVYKKKETKKEKQFSRWNKKRTGRKMKR